MHKILIRILSILFAFLIIFNLGLVFAQDQASPSPAIQEIQTQRITGQIVKVEDSSLTMNTTEGVKEVNVPTNVNVSKNGNSVLVQDLKPGDGVIVTRSDNGDILSVDALSGNALDASKWVLPIGFGILVLVILAFLAWFRMRKEYIKTTSSK